ncbi:MAG: DNA replication/repair protein RecF [Clostridia bacterium]|nr:DNA replication/repair protein RecF [Clostridia bacterium]
MKVNQLEAAHFRNIDNMCLHFGENVNIIYGENAQGKTNILEALWLFTGLKSFRSSKDAEQVQFGREKAIIRVQFTADAMEQNAAIEFGEKKNVFLNEVKMNSVNALGESFHAIIFSPEHLSLIKGGPKERRQFCDSALCQIKPGFGEYLSKYKKNLAQRNAILKDYRYNSSIELVLDIFEENLAQLGTQIILQRKRYLEALQQYAEKIYAGISSGKEKIEILYRCCIEAEEKELKQVFLEALKKSREEDMQTLSTSVGPHRDDIEILINGISARKFGSQGQQRSAVLALKLGEANVLSKKTGQKPIALLDDVMSELDEMRQDYILHHIEGWQVFITCCDPHTILRLKEGKTFHIHQGKQIEET